MQKCYFNNVVKQLYWNHASAWVFSCKFAAYFKNTFSSEHLWTAGSDFRDTNFVLQVISESQVKNKTVMS